MSKKSQITAKPLINDSHHTAITSHMKEEVNNLEKVSREDARDLANAIKKCGFYK